MTRALVAAALLAMAGSAGASDVAVGVNALSLHTASGYETFTPGVYARSTGQFFAAGGVFRNSYGFTTYHAGLGYSYQYKQWDASIVVGASYGYRDYIQWLNPDGSVAYTTYESPMVQPFVMPSVGYRFAEEWGGRLFVIPPIRFKADIDGSKPAWCFSIAVERYF